MTPEEREAVEAHAETFWTRRDPALNARLRDASDTLGVQFDDSESERHVGYFIGHMDATRALREENGRLREALQAERAAVPFPGLSSSSANALAYEIEHGADALHRTTTGAKASWLRDIARQLNELEAARAALTRHPEQAR